jgi:NAD(P)-dependent dehydrogenase (short-subunit alcohol dehydrogenase family)
LKGNNVRLKDKVAVITGGGAGIGRAATELFAKEGAKVVIMEINEKVGSETEKAITQQGGAAKFIRADISNSDSVAGAFAQIEKLFGSIHVLYNNASIFLGGTDGPVAQLSTETWHKVLGCNLHGLFYCCKYAIPLLLKAGGGSIINTSSSAGVIGIPKCDAYTATKGATVSLTKSMAVEYGPHNIRVNCIAPAAIRTAMVAQSNFNDPDFDESIFLKTTPVRRWGTPEEIAKIALFLASDESSYLNGAIIVADGGITIT